MMYCPHCGAQSMQGLKYCTRCGVNLAPSQDTTPPPKFPFALTLLFLAVIGFIAIAGLVVPLVAATEFADRGAAMRDLLPIFVLGPAATLGVVALLIRLLSRLIKIYHDPGSAFDAKQKAVTQPVEARIAPLPEPMLSVTENTTRTFEPVEHIIGSPESKEKVTR